MATCERDASFTTLDLPAEFEDLEGLIRADLKAVVGMLAHRAHERLWLTGREFDQIQETLWNGLVDAVNTALVPLSVENR